jgi:hypothetical protein
MFITYTINLWDKVSGQKKKPMTKSHTLCTKISEWVTKAECKLYVTRDMEKISRVRIIEKGRLL